MAATLSPAHQSFLAFDFGTRRIGVASGTRLLGSAEPRGTIRSGDWDAVAALVGTWQPDALVIGVEGRAEIPLGGVVHAVGEGDSLLMPANVTHAIRPLGGFKMLLVMIRGEKQ